MPTLSIEFGIPSLRTALKTGNKNSIIVCKYVSFRNYAWESSPFSKIKIML